MLSALPAFWVGLLYDDEALETIEDYIKNWTAEDRATLHKDVPSLGLQSEIAGRKAHDVARDIIEIAKAGLKRRAKLHTAGHDETVYLSPLFEIVHSGQTASDQLLSHFNTYGIEHIFKEARL
jgi:glutamate--cysteine ligase